jgi:hypothetical protein
MPNYFNIPLISALENRSFVFLPLRQERRRSNERLEADRESKNRTRQIEGLCDYLTPLLLFSIG